MNPKEEAVLKLISEDKSYENYFFKKVKDLKWFYPLKERGYFKADKNIPPQASDKDGYVYIPQWNVLDYLERVAEQVEIDGNEEYIDELLQIIKETSTLKNNEEEVTNNYRTWWYFIKILLKIPNNKVTLEILDLLPIWLSSPYGGSLVDADAATKLLPKFLYEGATEDDLKKAEKIINYLTDYKWVKKRGVFTAQEDEADGVVEDHWLIDSFLEHGLAKLSGKLCGKDIVYILAEKVKSVLFHKVNSRINVDNGGLTYRLSVKIEEDFKYKLYISTYKKKTVNGEEDFRDDYAVDAKTLFVFNIEAEDANTFSQELINKLKSLDIPLDVKQKMQEEATSFYSYIYQDYSYIWFKNLDSLPLPRRLHDFKHVLLAILVESFFEMQTSTPEDAKEVVESFLSKKYQHQVFRRIAITLIAKNWVDYKNIFWDKLITGSETPLLEDPAFEDEMRYLLKENIDKFSTEEKSKIDDLIAQGPQKYLIEEEKERYIFYWKQRWYGVLKEDNFFADKYLAIKSKSTYDEEKERKEGESGWIGPGPSPLSEEDILSKRNKELAQIISTFKETDILGNSPSAEGLAKALENAVKREPNKFAQDMEPFINTGFYYLDYMLDGFKFAWANNIAFDWHKLLVFIFEYINRPIFWKNKLTVKAGFYDADYKWVIGSFGELVQEGTKNDEWSIPTEDFSILKKIFMLIAENIGKDDKKVRDFPNHVINCGLGKANIGLLYLTLRIARIEKKNDRPVWDKDLKKVLEVLLSRSIYDTYTVLGENLISFAYLDKKWTEEKITTISKTKDKILWEAFMSGYLAAGRVNLDLYKLLKNDYIRALSFNFEESMLNERLVDHIGIGYLNGVETIDGNGLLAELWKKWNPEKIRALISYFWSQRQSLIEKDGETEQNKEMRLRIIKFWEDIYKKGSTIKTLSKTDKEILSDTVKLSAFITEINEENFKWFLLSAPYVQDHYEAPYLLERLNDLKDRGVRKDTAERIAKIYLEILKGYKPDYDANNIHSIIEFLYATDDPTIKQLANKICNEYAKSGVDIVTDIYNKNNP